MELINVPSYLARESILEHDQRWTKLWQIGDDMASDQFGKNMAPYVVYV